VNPRSARTLVAAAIIADLVAMMVMSPTAWFALAILAAVLAACPAAFARKGPQITGILVLILSIAVAVFAYPEYKKSMAQYVERAKQQADKRKAVKPARVAEKAMKKDEEVVDKAVTPAPETAKKMDDEGVAKETELTTK